MFDKKSLYKKKIAVLWGGWSQEREISHESAKSCAKALAQRGFQTVDLLDVAQPTTLEALLTHTYDVAFVAMHGKWGEDGSIQGFLELLHMPYTFSDVLGCSLASHKDVAKQIYQAASIPVAPAQILEVSHTKDDSEKPSAPSVLLCSQAKQRIDAQKPTCMLLDTYVDTFASRLSYPLFVKPCINGSSYGVTKVEESAQLAPAIQEAASSSERVMVEQAIQGTEITVPVIGGSHPRALPPIQINCGSEFYNTKVKYEQPTNHHIIPAQLPQDVIEQAQQFAVAAHESLHCWGASRSDFIVSEQNTPYILETNVIPGMTATSLLPDSAAHAGITFPELCEKFVCWAFERNE